VASENPSVNVATAYTATTGLALQTDAILNAGILSNMDVSQVMFNETNAS
jgi:hypothetical protein